MGFSPMYHIKSLRLDSLCLYLMRQIFYFGSFEATSKIWSNNKLQLLSLSLMIYKRKPYVEPGIFFIHLSGGQNISNTFS